MVRAPRSHRGGRRFKSSIAHQLKGIWELWALARTPAGRGGGTADALRSGRSILTDVWVQIPPSAPNSFHALVAQRIERCPAEAEVVSSNLAKRTTLLVRIRSPIFQYIATVGNHCCNGSLRLNLDELLDPLIRRIYAVDASLRVRVDLVHPLECPSPRYQFPVKGV